jgi:hypothetical protein
VVVACPLASVTVIGRPRRASSVVVEDRVVPVAETVGRVTVTPVGRPVAGV